MEAPEHFGCYRQCRQLITQTRWLGQTNDSICVDFLVVAIIAGLLRLSGVAGAATNIAWLLFLVGLVMAIFFFFRGRGAAS